jgi:hypothetical protein
MFDLQRHGFLQTRNWVPDGPFHARFPCGSQVNRYESTVAYAYTVGSIFAFKVNELMRADEWDILFQEYGPLVKCLWSYIEKMQDSYGKKQTLYRGMVADEGAFREQYPVGSTISWSSFSSTSTDMAQSLEFAQGKYADEGAGVPVLFVIETRSRGAPILQWSRYPDEEEVLLAPFQCFQVQAINKQQIRGTRSPTLVIKLHTAQTPSAGSMSFSPAARVIEDDNSDDKGDGAGIVVLQCVASKGVAYRYSRNLAARTDDGEGVMRGDLLVTQCITGNWCRCSESGHWIPLSVDGDQLFKVVRR